MNLSDRSLLDCDPFGVIPINDTTPPFICALFGNDDNAIATVAQDIQSCCSPYYPAQYTTGYGCDHHWCGVPAYEAKGTDTSTWEVVPYPTEGTSRSTVTSTTTQIYDAIVAYPKVSSCLSSVALWNAYGFLAKGRLCWQAQPTGVWGIHANSKISIPWATWPDSTGYYADGKEQNERPIPFDTNNPQMKAAGLVSSPGDINFPNLHCANKSTAAGTALAIAYNKSIWDVSMEDFVVFSTAPETPFERLVSYTIPYLSACDECVCASAWVACGCGQQNMYMAPHKCGIINTNGGKRPPTPAKLPGPGVKGPKQIIAALQANGNNVNYKAGADQVPVKPSSAGSPVDITSGSGGTYPRSNRRSDGRIIATYTAFSDGNSQIAFARSTNGGASWTFVGTAATRPSASSDLDNPYVLQLPSGRLLVAFRNHDKNSPTGTYKFFRITISYSNDNGATWKYLSDPSSDPAGPNGDWEPFKICEDDIALYPRSLLARRAADDRENSQSDQDNLMRTSSDGGKTWSTARIVSDASVTSRDGMIGVATVSGSSLIAVFKSNESGHFAMNSVTTNDDGKTWGIRRQDYSPTGNGKNAGAAQVINVGGTLVVSFMTDEDNQLGQWISGASSNLITSVEDGTTWSNKIEVFASQANWPDACSG
ncbi:hypothetical protein MBLNU13_g05098t2 [Cladosporium sp. NU13]